MSPFLAPIFQPISHLNGSSSYSPQLQIGQNKIIKCMVLQCISLQEKIWTSTTQYLTSYIFIDLKIYCHFLYTEFLSLLILTFPFSFLALALSIYYSREKLLENFLTRASIQCKVWIKKLAIFFIFVSWFI